MLVSLFGSLAWIVAIFIANIFLIRKILKAENPLKINVSVAWKIVLTFLIIGLLKTVFDFRNIFIELESDYSEADELASQIKTVMMNGILWLLLFILSTISWHLLKRYRIVRQVHLNLN